MTPGSRGVRVYVTRDCVWCVGAPRRLFPHPAMPAQPRRAVCPGSPVRHAPLCSLPYASLHSPTLPYISTTHYPLPIPSGRLPCAVACVCAALACAGLCGAVLCALLCPLPSALYYTLHLLPCLFPRCSRVAGGGWCSCRCEWVANGVAGVCGKWNGDWIGCYSPVVQCPRHPVSLSSLQAWLHPRDPDLSRAIYILRCVVPLVPLLSRFLVSLSLSHASLSRASPLPSLLPSLSCPPLFLVLPSRLAQRACKQRLRYTRHAANARRDIRDDTAE